MTSSLVGSEMCIRDRGMKARPQWGCLHANKGTASHGLVAGCRPNPLSSCLLYTSDAADDM
eukprot:9236771-Prorocentrum_lima.AAC.1